MRVLVIVAAAAALAACGPRKVEVTSSPQTANRSDVSVTVTNNLSQPITVYVVSGGSEIFLGQVSARSSVSLAVRDVAAGSQVTLRATPADGARTYSRPDVILNSGYNFVVP